MGGVTTGRARVLVVAVVAMAMVAPTWLSGNPPAAAVQDDAADGVAPPATPVQWRPSPPESWPAPPPASARSYVLADARTGQVLSARAADEPRVVASTIKLLTILVALETLSGEDMVVVGQEAAVGGAGASVDPGETWRVDDLLDAVLVRSGNDAARALAAAASDGDMEAFVARMRAAASVLGLTDVVIDEPTGLDDTNRLSARALATIARAALSDERIRSSAGKAVVDLPDAGPQESRNLLIGDYEGATGLKTGFTDLAGYCLVASAERDGRELVAVVLGSREDPARFDEAAALFDHAFQQLQSVPHEALRARSPGRWDELLPGGRTWAPRDRTVRVGLDGSTTQLALRFTADDQVLGTTSVELPDAAPDGLGGVLGQAVYRGMRQGHVAGLWPDGPDAGTAGAGSG